MNSPAIVQTNQSVTVKSMLSQDAYKKRFFEILGKKSNAFMASLMNLVGQDNKLQKCEPQGVIMAAAIAATLDLPIDPNLGFAYIIPYKNKASLQLGYKAFVQLAIRSGQYRTINAAEIYEGELIHFNRITGDFEIDPGAKKSDNIVGYGAYFRLLNGFEKFIYMTVSELKEHAKKYSQSYRYAESGRKDSMWHKDEKAMMTKTVLKRLLSKYGILSIDMEKALSTDIESDKTEFLKPSKDYPQVTEKLQTGLPEPKPMEYEVERFEDRDILVTDAGHGKKMDVGHIEPPAPEPETGDVDVDVMPFDPAGDGEMLE